MKDKILLISLLILIIALSGCIEQPRNNSAEQPRNNSAVQDNMWVVKFNDDSYLDYYPAQIRDDYNSVGISYSVHTLLQQGIEPLDNDYYLLLGQHIRPESYFVLVNVQDSSEIGNYLHALPQTKDDSKLVKEPFSEWYVCDKVNQGIHEGVLPSDYSQLYNRIIGSNELSAKCEKII